MTKAGIYLRVSTKDQKIKAQRDKVMDYCKIHNIKVMKEYIDKLSGKNTERPQFQKLMKDAEDKLFDTVIVWKMSRFGRSAKDLLNNIDELKGLDINFISISESIDTGTPLGRLLRTVLAGVVEFQREVIVENINMGLQRAKKEGKRLGKVPLKIKDPVKFKQIKLLKKQGYSINKIARELEMQPSSVHHILKKRGVKNVRGSKSS